MSKRRFGKGVGLAAASCLYLGAVAAMCALFMPWISVDSGVLQLFGSVPAEPVPGYRIPALVRASGGDPVIQGGAAARELLSGRLDLVAARILFGERYEEEWAPIVLLPAVWCLLCALLPRVRRLRALVALIAALNVLFFAAVAAAAFQVGGGSPSSSFFQVSLLVHDGVWATLGAVFLTTAGSFLLAMK